MTLIEVMVAVAIILILAAVITKVSTALYRQAKTAKSGQIMLIVSDAVEAFKQQTGYLPLAVPYDAWDEVDADRWRHFVDNESWNGPKPLWTDYFTDSVPATVQGRPVFNWTTPTTYPTNADMLAYQLAQVPEAARILDQLSSVSKVEKYRAFDAAGGEAWPEQPTPCQFTNPLSANTDNATQLQDAWGTPLRYWTAETIGWAKVQGWDASVQNLIADKVRGANWGFYIESAGVDRKFGWWGAAGSTVDDRYAKDNMYSTNLKRDVGK